MEENVGFVVTPTMEEGTTNPRVGNMQQEL